MNEFRKKKAAKNGIKKRVKYRCNVFQVIFVDRVEDKRLKHHERLEVCTSICNVLGYVVDVVVKY